MTLARRRFLHLSAGAAAIAALPRAAAALDYPARQVRLIVGFPAGTGPDVIARLVGQRLWDRLGQQFIVEDRSGAGSSLAAQDVIGAPADATRYSLPPTRMQSTPAFIQNCLSISCATLPRSP